MLEEVPDQLGMKTFDAKNCSTPDQLIHAAMISANCERQMKSQQEFRQHLRMRCRDQVSEAIWDCFEAPVGRRASVRVKINWKHRGNERFALYSSCLELFKLASVSLRLSAGRAQDAKAKTLEIVNVKVLAGLRKMKVGCNVFFGCHNPHRKKHLFLATPCIYLDLEIW